MNAIRVLALVVAVALAVVPLTPLAGEAQVQCGAKLLGDTTLTASDPVVFTPGDTPCPKIGLTIAEAITLDCAGLTIKGDGSDTGIKISSGIEGVFITNCVIDGFKTGIELGGKGSHSVEKTVVINSKGIGVSITTDFNSLTGTIATKNGGIGIQIKGDLNSLDQCLAVENGKAGFSVQGEENSITGSVGILNGAEGLLGNVRTSVIIGNVLANNKGDGLKFQGATLAEPNEFGDNKAIGNGGNGIIVSGKNADLNFDDGGNVGLANAGATQCQIGPDPCQWGATPRRPRTESESCGRGRRPGSTDVGAHR